MGKLNRFENFIALRFELSDWGNYVSKGRIKLLRHKIIDECDFPRSILYQNPGIKQRLQNLEAELRSLGILRRNNLEPDKLLDESAVIGAAAEMNSRLDSLDKRMASLMSSIEEVRRQLKICSKEQNG